MSKVLAQLNIARAVAPKGDSRVAGFYDNVDIINASAEGAKGFVWRLQDESTDSTREEAFPDPLLVVNLSVWKDLDHLRKFTYKTSHVEFIRRRHEWFRRIDGPSLVMWWIDEGDWPSLLQGKQKLDHLAAHGPSVEAFTFGAPFDQNGSAVRQTEAKRGAKKRAR